VLGTEKIRLPDLLGRSCSGSATPDPQSLLPPLPPTHTQIAVVRISSRTADGDEAISSFGQQPPPDAQLAMTSVINRRQGTTRRPRQRGRERATPSVLPRRTMRCLGERASDGSQKWIPLLGPMLSVIGYSSSRHMKTPLSAPAVEPHRHVFPTSARWRP
jgi:hypothetical protein